MAQVQVKGSKRFFKNPFLELLTKSHPAVILAIYIPTCALLVYYYYITSGSVQSTLSYFGIGFLAWTLAEYILHRYVFHFVNETQWSQKFHYVVHGVHHEYPKDRTRLVMPPLPSLCVATLFFLGFRAIMGAPSYAFFSGFIIGYLAYAMVHYILHAYRAPKGRLKFWWEHHNRHHFSHPNHAFGVSTPLWDYIFRTMPPVKTKARTFVTGA